MATERDVESFSDFIQYYSSHFVKSRNDPHVMYYVSGAADHEKRSAMVRVYRDGRPDKEILWDQAMAWGEVEWGLPLIGMTVFNDVELVYLYYRTARNGGRGFAPDRVMQRSFNGWQCGGNNLPQLRKDDIGAPVNAWLAMTPRHSTLEAAWEAFNSEVPPRLAYALSYRFGVYLSMHELPVLCYKAREVGTVSGPNRIQLKQNERELADVVRRVLNPAMEIEIV